MKIAIVGTGIAGNVAAQHLHARARDHRVRGRRARRRPHAHGRASSRRAGATPSTPASSSSTTGPTRTSSRCSTSSGVASQPSDDELQRALRARAASSTTAPRSTRCSPSARNLLRPSFLAHDARHPALQPRGAGAARRARRRRCTLGRVPRARRLLAAPSSSTTSCRWAPPIWSADPASMLRLPGALLRALLPQPRHAVAWTTGPQWRVIARRLARATWRSSRRRSATASACARRSTAVRRDPGSVDGQAARAASAERFDARGPRLPQRPGAARCSPTRRAAEREVLGAIPYQAQRGRAAHRHAPAAAPAPRLGGWNYHVLPRARRAASRVTYNMNILQGLDAPDAVPASRSTAATRSTPTQVMRAHHLPPPGLHAGRASRRRRARREINGARAHLLLRRLLGHGFHEDGVESALAALEHFRADDPCTARSTTGRVRHRRYAPRPHAFGYRLFMAVPRPRRARPRLPRPLALVGASARRSPGSGARTTSAIRRVPLDEAVRDRVERETGRAPGRARSACSPTCATSATASTR